MNKITIIGGSGSGKTTLANNLGKKLDLPVYHIDGINYLENWEQRDKQERDRIILEKIEEEKWVIDGTYMTTIEKRIEKSDLVIFLDCSTISHLYGILTRYFKNKKIEKEEIPGCKEKMDLKFLKYTVRYNRNKRKKIYNILEKYNNKEIVILKNKRQINKWLNKI